MEVYLLAKGLVHKLSAVDFHNALVFLKQAFLSGSTLVLHSTDVQSQRATRRVGKKTRLKMIYTY